MSSASLNLSSPSMAATESGPRLWFGEVLPRLCSAGGVIGVILVNSTMPQVVKTSDGAMPKLTPSLWLRMGMRILPKAGGLKAAQYGCMREMKLGLDSLGCNPAVSKMLAFGVIGTGFQSVIYNLLIADMYKIHTGKNPQPLTVRTLVTGTMPGIVWCFGRETFSMGAGIALQPFVAGYVKDHLAQNGYSAPPPKLLSFVTGFATGGVTALATQWLHNTTLVAGRMAAQGVREEAPHYTAGSLRTAYRELGGSLFYMNYPQRMCLIAGACGFFALCDIFHRPDVRCMGLVLR
eukprot:TRINITY_DN24239_c0_g1_i1.p1 TRINITY_DN24239_c0_g1~~TRINITY_DN24239_c0_g1_i1.p1  ORF type:complete len:292 (+),score=44.88 TRINITY_DN24239_c0_g1_i1:53-928(+)